MTIDHLTELLKDDKMCDSDRAEIAHMRKSNLEKFIRENHKYAISEVIKKSYHGYKTRIDSTHHLSAKTLDELYERLYDHYTGKTLSDRATIGNILDAVLEWHYRPDQIKTQKRQREIYESVIKNSEIDKKLLKDITVHDIDKFLRSFDNKLTSAMYGNIKSLLNLVFDYACIELDIFPYNPCRSIKVSLSFLPEKTIGSKAYTRAEAEQIVRHLYASKNTYHEALVFIFYTGLRFSEVSDLKWTDIDDDVLLVTHAHTESGNVKKGSCGEFPLSPEALSLINRYKRERPDTDLVFPNHAGHIMQNNHLNEALQSVCEELGIPYRSSHKIRAYNITFKALECGILSAQRQARHTTPLMTNRYISKAITSRDREDAKVLDFGILPNSPNEKTS